jgi:hypothetical protein
MNTEQEIKSVRKIVEHLLETDERCRNDDKWLTYLVMRRFTNIYIPFEDFKKIPAFETVKRCRAQIQNKEKRFKPTNPEILMKRQSRERTFNQINRLTNNEI